ncbi:MAG: 6-hydroxymethylpterin diphosphokinase MptE-like protein, partial [Campylobacterota bacterium]|nr:6-hydroxymethylpterin diphosphokinase MptE-like protein [Campylobacterota bacterium]
ITAMISAGQAYRMNFLRRLNIYKLSLQKVVDNNNLLNINKKIYILNDKKVIVVGAGPSLDKNIDWFCQHKDSFIIVSVGASLPTLLKYNITPDIVVEVHPELDMLATYKKFNKDNLKDIIFLGANQIPKELLEQFNIDNSFIFLTNMIIKEHLGVKTGTSVGNVAIYLSLMFQPKELYFLGIDFALSSEGTTHTDSHAYRKKLDDTTQMDIKQKNYIHEGNLFAVKGNLKESVLTNSLFYKFLEGANNELSLYKNNNIFNLSDGAYIENTTPLKADDVEISSIYDKVNFKQEFKNELENISEHGLNTEDLESINNMIKLLNDYTTTEYNDKDIRKYFNDILINKNLDGAYKELILNFVQMIFHYVDGFLNDESFNFKQRTKHIKNMDKLLYQHFIKLTIDYKKILEDKIK